LIQNEKSESLKTEAAKDFSGLKAVCFGLGVVANAAEPLSIADFRFTVGDFPSTEGGTFRVRS
jgi:hypothetical protein